MGWILDWFNARWDRVVTALDVYWLPLNDYLRNLYTTAYIALWQYRDRLVWVVFTFWLNVYYLMITGYDRLNDWIEKAYVNARQVAVDWFGMAYLALNQYKLNLASLLVALYDNVLWLTSTFWTSVHTFFLYLFGRADALLDGLWVNVVETFITHWNRLFYFLNDAWTFLYWLTFTVPNNIYNLARDWFGVIESYVHAYYVKVQTFFTVGYIVLQNLVNDNVKKLDTFLNGAFPALLSIVSKIQAVTYFLTSDVAGKILSLTQTWYSQLTNFLQQPGATIFAYIEAYLWPWADGLVAEWLGAVKATLPPRQSVFGGGGVPLPGGGAPPPGSVGKFAYPEVYHVLSGYDFGPDHPGLDFRATLGLPIHASAAGSVRFVGDTGDGYGIHVDLDHGGGWLTRYAHFSGVSCITAQQVTQGQQIGLAGSTGHSTGPHLHFEIRLNNGPLNPWLLLPPP